MGRIEACLGSNGFAVGSKLSLADIVIYNAFAEHLKDSEAKADMAQWKREAFGSKARTDAKLDKHPKLKASCQAVATNAGIAQRLSTRGVQGF